MSGQKSAPAKSLGSDKSPGPDSQNSITPLPDPIAASTALARLLGLIQLRRFVMEQRERTVEENIQQTIDFMRANLSRPLSLRELASLANVSVSRFEVAFAKRTDCSPISYFNRMRIQKASRLLNESDLPVKAICADVGLNDPYYVSRLFKRMTGVFPVKFRRSFYKHQCPTLSPIPVTFREGSDRRTKCL